MSKPAVDDPLVAYLIDAAETDKEKGGSGYRSTETIVEVLRHPRSVVMRYLLTLEHAGSVKRLEIKGAVASPKRFWRVTDTVRSAEQGDAAL